jgi:hypothetical protein
LFPARIVCVFVTFFLQGKFGDVYAAVERASRDAGTSDGRTDLGTWGTAWKCGSWVLIGLPGLVNVNKKRWKIIMLSIFNGKINYFDMAMFNSYVSHYQRVLGYPSFFRAVRV